MIAMPGVFGADGAHHDSPNIHNMMVVGQESVFLSHLPMFEALNKDKTEYQTPHRYQVLLARYRLLIACLLHLHE